jgi:hypothetical protein
MVRVHLILYDFLEMYKSKSFTVTVAIILIRKGSDVLPRSTSRSFLSDITVEKDKNYILYVDKMTPNVLNAAVTFHQYRNVVQP